MNNAQQPNNDNNNPNRSKGRGGANRQRQIRQKQPDAFKPTNLQSTCSQERNDPLLIDAVLVDGVNEAIACARERKFRLDYSQYIQIIRSSYHRLDKGLQKFLSYSCYQYYCVVLLWKRLQYVLTGRGNGVNEYEAFRRKLPPMDIPIEIGYYLDGIGNIADYNQRVYTLELQDFLRQTLTCGVSGTFGPVDPVSHLSYETLPSPFVAVYRILQDMANTSANQPLAYDRNWNLPIALRPEGPVFPNRNLLCWDRSSMLTVEQLSMFQNAGLNITFLDCQPVFETPGVDNVNGFPIIYSLLLQTSVLLSRNCNHAEAVSYNGSLAQVGYIERDGIPIPAVGYALPPLSERDGKAMFYNQASIYMCSATSLFRYRIKRVIPGSHDSLCFTDAHGGSPAEWHLNADDIFKSAAAWNMGEFRTTIVNGLSVCDRYSERIRKISPHQKTRKDGWR